MDDDAEIELKKICCTCLSVDRKLIQLCKINEGVNNLYFLLSYDPEAYKEGFFKDLASLHICWECRAIIRGIVRFRLQACVAQRQLSSPKIKHFETLSKLSTHLKSSYDDEIISTSLDNLDDNFIDCDAVEVKTEMDDDDVPLSQLHTLGAVEDEPEESPYNGFRENNSEKGDISELQDNISDDLNEKTLKTNIKLKKEKTETEKTRQRIKKTSKEFYKTVLMDEKEMLNNREKRKQDVEFMETENKCESCLESFKTQTELSEHNVMLHSEQPDHIICDICLCHVPKTTLLEHRNTHLLQYTCLLCEHNVYSIDEVVKHLDLEHGLKNLGVTVKRKKGVERFKLRKNAAMMDNRTTRGYQCTECNKYFENKNQRWRHVQRCHSEGYRCHTCGKRFAFRHSLTRHEHECIQLLNVSMLLKCLKALATRRCITRHVRRAHHGLKESARDKICQQCGKAFRDKKGLREHELIHTGERPLSCEVCGCSFRQSASLYTHKKRVHKIHAPRKQIQLLEETSNQINTDF